MHKSIKQAKSKVSTNLVDVFFPNIILISFSETSFSSLFLYILTITIKLMTYTAREWYGASARFIKCMFCFFDMLSVCISYTHSDFLIGSSESLHEHTK